MRVKSDIEVVDSCYMIQTAILNKIIINGKGSITWKSSSLSSIYRFHQLATIHPCTSVIVLTLNDNTHLTLLDTVLLCFFPPSDDSLLSIEGLSGSLAEPTRPELEVLLSDNAIEIEVNPGSVLCLSLSLAVGCPGCRIASFGVGEIRLNSSGIRALDVDSAGWGSGGGGIARDAEEDGEKGIEVGRAVDSRGGSRSRCEEERCLCCDSDNEWWG